MFLVLVLTSSLFIGSMNSQFDDMDNEDFAGYLKWHDDVGAKYGETATKGCVTGGIGGSPGGFQALCIGCVVGAVGNVAQDILFPEKK